MCHALCAFLQASPAQHRTDGPQKQIVAQIPENSFLLWWQSQQYQQAAWSLKYNFWQTLCHHSWWEIWFRAAFLQNSSKSARWPSWKQFSDNLLRQKWPEELRSYAPTKSLNLMTFNIWHSTNGPMDQRTNGPMDQWTNGPMDQWTNGPIVQWTNGPMDQWSHGPIVQWS